MVFCRGIQFYSAELGILSTEYSTDSLQRHNGSEPKKAQNGSQEPKKFFRSYLARSDEISSRQHETFVSKDMRNPPDSFCVGLTVPGYRREMFVCSPSPPFEASEGQ